MRNLLLLACFLLFSTIFFGQKIQGAVQDSLNKKPLQGAEVLLIHLPDSTQQGMFSDENGQFLFAAVKKGKYVLQVQFIGYSPNIQALSIEKEVYELTILMKEKTLQGDSVLITTTALEVMQKGDTTEYNANAHKLQNDATAEDLVKKMTGISIDNEGVKTQGEAVTKVLVDGKPFFDNNPKTALANLPAKAVQKVQIYDEKNKLNPSAEASKTMNIVTNPNMREGVFGKVNAGYGYKNKYIAGGTINHFNGKRRVSLIGKSNNINEQGFGFEEIGEMMGGSVSRQGGGGVTIAMPNGMRGANAFDLIGGNARDGISTAHSLGMNFNDSWRKKIDVAATYFGNINNNLQQSNITRQYLLGNEQLYKDIRTAKDYSMMHKISTKLTYNIDSLNTLEIRPTFSITNSEYNSLANTTTNLAALRLNESENKSNGKSNNYTIGNSLDFNRNFRKPKRSLSMSMRGSYYKQQSNSDFTSQNTYYNDTTFVDSINQRGIAFYNNSNINGDFSYSEPIGKTSLIRLGYSPSFAYRLADKSTYNFVPLEQKYANLDSNLSNNFVSRYLTQVSDVSYIYEKEKFNLSIKAAVQYATLSGNQFFPFEDNIKRNFLNFLPEISVRNTLKNKANINIRYNTSTSAPDMMQLQNVINNRNPLIISVGNPELKQSYQHNISTRYRHANLEKNTSFSAFIRADYQQHSIASTTIFMEKDTIIGDNYLVEKGVQIRQPINLNGYSGANVNVNQGFPLSKIKCKGEVGLSAAFRHRPSLFNYILNRSYSSNISSNIRLNSNISEKIDFSISLNPSYAWVINSINTTQNTAFFNLGSNFNGNWVFYKQFFVGTNVSYQYYKGLSDNYSPNYLLWNMTFGSKFGKKQQWKLSLYSFDLLNQNRSVGRTTAESYVEDKQSNVLSRYFMLSLGYNFTKFKDEKK